MRELITAVRVILLSLLKGGNILLSDYNVAASLLERAEKSIGERDAK
jgi:hypothetical protein